jgi:chromosomal replication initiation ATPase DnaA
MSASTEELESLKNAVVEMIQRDFFLVPRKPEIYTKDREDMIEHIIQFVSNRLHISVSLIKSKTRLYEVVWARYIVFYMCYRYCKKVMSLKFIGSFVGHRDHATVLNGLKKIRSRMEIETVFREDIERYCQDFYRDFSEDIKKFKANQ